VIAHSFWHDSDHYLRLDEFADRRVLATYDGMSRVLLVPAARSAHALTTGGREGP
jgi:hypothetical protein